MEEFAEEVGKQGLIVQFMLMSTEQCVYSGMASQFQKLALLRHGKSENMWILEFPHNLNDRPFLRNVSIHVWY